MMAPRVSVSTLMGAGLCLALLAPQANAGGVGAGFATVFEQRAEQALMRSEQDKARTTMRDEGSSTREQIRRSGIDNSEYITESLRQHAGQLSGYMDKQIEAMRRFFDGAQQNDAMRERQLLRAKAESGRFDPPRDACLRIGLYKRPNGRSPSTGTTLTNNAMGRLSGTDPAVRAGGTEYAASVAADAMRDWSGVPFVGGRFTNPTADMGVIFGSKTLPRNDAQFNAIVERLVMNAIDATPPRPISETEMQTPEGVARAAVRQSVLARQTATKEALALVLNARHPVIEVTQEWRTLVDEAAYPEEEKPALGAMISELQALDIRTVNHYARLPESGANRQVMDTNEALANILDVLGLIARMEYIQLEIASRGLAVDALSLASMNDSKAN